MGDANNVLLAADGSEDASGYVLVFHATIL